MTARRRRLAGARPFALALLLALPTLGCVSDGGMDPDDPGPDPSQHCPPLDPITCATDIGGRFPQTVGGDTTGADDGYSGSRCGIGGGIAVEDAAFRWTAPRDGFYRFSTEGSSFDTLLSVRPGSCGGAEMTCNDDAVEGSGYSALTLELSECETVTLVIDGADAAGVGAFTLSVTSSEHACFDGVDDDDDGLIDCDDPDCAGPRCDVERGEWPADWAQLEQRVLEAVNQRRAEGAVCGGEAQPPAPPVELDVLLELAARRHSLDMTDNDYFSHTSLDGREPADRTAEAGYPSAFIGENIAGAYETVEQVMAGWMSSPGHCLNIMNPDFRYLGVGHADGPGGIRWTQNFGGPF